MDHLIFILMAHMVGDYLFQSDYLVQNKGKDDYILLAHSVLYAFGVAVVCYVLGVYCNGLYLLIIGGTHFLTDYLKAKDITTNYFGDRMAFTLDQLIHYFVLTILFI